MKEKRIKDIYNLNYDNQAYGLSIWYNQLIDKPINKISIRDVFSMIFNDILPDLAIEKAIEFFIRDPFDGEMYDGQLLKLFVESSEKFFQSKSTQLDKMIDIISSMDNEAAQSKEQWGYGYDYDEEGCHDYLELLVKAKQIIMKRKSS